MEIAFLFPQSLTKRPLVGEVLQWLPPQNGTDSHNQFDHNFGSRPDTSLDFPFLTSSALEDATSILRYINVSILFYEYPEGQTNQTYIVHAINQCHQMMNVQTE